MGRQKSAAVINAKEKVITPIEEVKEVEETEEEKLLRTRYISSQ